MTPDETPDRDTLSSMKVSELRQMCSEQGLLVSGKKDELINRLLGLPDAAKSAPAASLPRSPEDIDDAIDRLISRVSGEAPSEDEPEPEEPEEEVLEAEILDAEMVEEEPEPEETEATGLEDEEDDPWFSGVISSEESPEIYLDDEDGEEPSMVITLPSVANIQSNWRPISAVVMVVLLVGAIAFYIVQDDPAFTARPLHYGDHMDFTITETTVSITGDELIGHLRDTVSPTLDDVCDELQASVTGTGSIAIRKGGPGDITHGLDTDLEGAVSARDAYGREHLTVEQILTHDLSIDLEGKVRNEGTCSNTGWIRQDNDLTSISKSWKEITGKSTVRTDTQVSFTDSDGVRSDARSVIYGTEGFGVLGDLAPILTFPLTPIELHDFFGDESLEGGETSNDHINWNSDWRWEVFDEINTAMHGLVYPIRIFHFEIGRCLGHAIIDIQVKQGSPWPVKQEVDIVIDKDLETSDCNFFVSAGTQAALPDGTLSVAMVLTETSSNAGSIAAHWGTAYAGSPGVGEDIPTDTRQWGLAMPDESEIRMFDLEAAVQCLMANYSTRDAALALDSGGYIWQAAWSEPTRSPEWNMSWVSDDDRSGWIILRSSCSLIGEGDYEDGEFKWNREAVPETLTLDLIETRILSETRYPELNQFIDSGANWNTDVTFAHRLSVSEENELLGMLPGGLGEGQVTIAGSRAWEDSGRDNALSFAMNAETGRMVAWFHTSLPAN